MATTKDKETKTAPKIKWDKFGKCVALVAWVGLANLVIPRIINAITAFIASTKIIDFSNHTPVWTAIFTTITYIITAAVIIIVPKYLHKSYKTNREELGLTGLPTFTDIGISVIGFVVSIIVSGVVLGILQNLHLVDSGQVQDIGYDNLFNPVDRIAAFISIVIVAPIFEETIFRGWLYGKLNKVIKNATILPIILVSVLFGALHGQWNVGITVGIMSAIICVERELTGTIYAGILTHMIKNGVAFWLLFVMF